MQDRIWLFTFNYVNFLIRQSIQFINQPVDLAVRGVYPALEDGFVMIRFCFCQFLVKRKHLLNQFHHPVVAGLVGGVGEVDGADGKLCKMILYD